MGKQLQFELWEECGNGCKWCYLGNNNKYTPKEVKLNSLQNALDKIQDLSNYPEFDTLSYLGGEFFQGQLKDQEVYDKFMVRVHDCMIVILLNLLRFVLMTHDVVYQVECSMCP